MNQGAAPSAGAGLFSGRYLMRSLGRWLALPALLLLNPLAGTAEDSKVEVKVVKYKGLEETLQGLKGKVVVVDFWADT
jgi:hypothetical protein